MTEALQQRLRVGRETQVEQRVLGPGAAEYLGIEAALRVSGHRRLDTAREAHALPALRRLAGAQVHQHLVTGQHALDQRLDLPAGGLDAEQPRLDHAGVVEDQQVAGVQQRRQVAEHPIDRRRAGTVEQPRPAAFGRRMLRNQLGRQVEIEVGKRVRSGHGKATVARRKRRCSAAAGLKRAAGLFHAARGPASGLRSEFAHAHPRADPD